MDAKKEAIYCLCKHFKCFHEQAIENKMADFGQPCSDCNLWDDCRGHWIEKISLVKPKDIEISVVRQALP